MDITPNQPMNEIRGTLILCDNVYRTDQGKWVIAGTYAQWQTTQDALTLPFLHAYVRLQFEHPGTYQCQLTMVDKAQPPQSVPMLSAQFDVSQPSSNPPVFEMGLQLPELRIQAPVPFSQRPPGSLIILHTQLWLRVRQTEIASCALDFHFAGPPVPTGQRPPASL